MKTLWLWWSGPGAPDLEVCWRAYVHRFDIEHTLRFVKQTLRLDRTARAPPGTSRPLDLARRGGLHAAALGEGGLVADCRLPWERPRHPGRLTPTRGASGFPPPGAGPRDAGESAKTQQGRSRAAQRQSPRPGAALPGDQAGGLTGVKLQA